MKVFLHFIIDKNAELRVSDRLAMLNRNPGLESKDLRVSSPPPLVQGSPAGFNIAFLSQHLTALKDDGYNLNNQHRRFYYSPSPLLLTALRR